MKVFPISEAVENYISGSEHLTAIYGGWPTFHDAEIIQLDLHRGDIQPAKDIYIFPILTAKIHLALEAPTSRESLATLRFHGIENLKLEGFNYQNAILSLRIKADPTHERSHPEHPILFIILEGAFGLSASFHCNRVEVLEVTPISE